MTPSLREGGKRREKCYKHDMHLSEAMELLNKKGKVQAEVEKRGGKETGG